MTMILRAFLLAGSAFAVVSPAFAQGVPPADNATLLDETGALDEAGPGEEGEVIIVQATRSGRRVQDEAVRVEVIGREEIEEKILMRPGNIAVVLSETGGIRVQVTSPALGASNVRVHGMDGRYTQILADGLPLYGGQASALGLLQIAPTDLGQVEIIKGAASALYGPSALGGVINLVSRRPRATAEAEVLLNVTSGDGQDITAYSATPLGEDFSGSVTGGLHRQSVRDLDDDGWIDVPGYRRATLRPRLYWDRADGASAFLTLGAMTESRRGGTLEGRTTPDGQPFRQEQDTDRLDAGLVAQLPLTDAVDANLRASASQQDHAHLYGPDREDDRHSTLFGEASLSGGAGLIDWVGGFAFQRDVYRNASLPQFDYAYDVPALFAQAESELSDIFTASGSARVDFHDTYGTQFSPRLSLLARPGDFTFRASVGRGFYAPTPFVEEIEAAGLSRLLVPQGLEAESAVTGSLDVGYAAYGFEATATLFASQMENAVRLETASPTSVGLVNSAQEERIVGGELLLRYRTGDFVVTGSYVYVDATEGDPDGAGRREIPLTPSHSAGLVAMWEKEGAGRIGLEAYYTGEQELEDNPALANSPSYWEFGVLAELDLGSARLFVNAENILGERQTSYGPLLRRTRAPDGRWTVDVWGPTEGFVVNGGVRLMFGGDR